MAHEIDDLREFIAEYVREGFNSAHEIVANAQDWATEHDRDDLVPEVNLLVAEAMAAQHAEQAGWESTTDCDRLDSAFAALDALGIVARQNFSCCNNCGFAEIWDEVEKAEKEHPVYGYVFYHLQCTEQAIKTGRLLMAYGCLPDDPQAFQSTARTIVAELQKAGLSASWGGTDHHPIVVDGIVWRRRNRTE